MRGRCVQEGRVPRVKALVKLETKVVLFVFYCFGNSCLRRLQWVWVWVWCGKRKLLK